MIRARVLLAIIVVGFSLVATACSGQHAAPSVEELQRDSKIIRLKLDDGRSITCLYYARSGSEGYGGYSWLALDCDWSSVRNTPQ